MATFPKLKTNAVAQYPAAKTIRYRHQTLQFLDGREQRYRASEGPRREWEVRLNLLDEEESSQMAEFFREQRGRLGSFAFTDPFDGTCYDDCSLERDELQIESSGEMKTQLTLRVVENKG